MIDQRLGGALGREGHEQKGGGQQPEVDHHPILQRDGLGAEGVALSTL